MSYNVTIETEFSAAHIIRGYNGPCSNLHGHNWKVTVEAKTEVLDEIGMSIDFYELQKKTDEIAARFDHRDINSVPPFDKELNPTSENIAFYIYQELKKVLPSKVELSFVAISETGKYTAKYSESS
ncbi:MAG: 6-carboxytetrahydropterin synthase QueD [Bacteroidetes bacterium]|nr:6-carboxytetrahydropterin synthase QueD [Bacteroidota bacterium]